METLVKVADEKYVEITYDPDTKVVAAIWKGYLKDDQVREGCAKITALIKEKQLKSHLSDHTQLKVLNKDVQDYLVNQWFAEVEKAGLRRIAVLVAEDVFAKATVDSVNDKAPNKDKLTINTYASVKDCMDFLV